MKIRFVEINIARQRNKCRVHDKFRGYRHALVDKNLTKPCK